MLSSAIIVFREIFEIVLIVGVVLAATRDMPNRAKAISFGFIGGIAGAAVIAYFTDTISEFGEGLGQEYMNATILFVAAGFIGWTLIWMKQHAHEMRAKFKEVGDAIKSGRASYITLSVIIALAVWREGSEIVLFSYGMLAAGETMQSIAMGGLIGGLGGFILGLTLYMGMIRLPLNVFFTVTSILLMFLVAGMVSQGIGFLSAAGLFETMQKTVWDSAWLLSEQGIVGETLSVLVGYTSRPSVVQLIGYVITLMVLVSALKMIDYKNGKTVSAGAATAALALFLIFSPQSALAGKSVTSPYVELGELEIESKTQIDIDDDAANEKVEQSFEVEYGVTDFMAVEAAIEFEDKAGNDLETKKAEIEAKFQLTETGEYFVDTGLKVGYEYSLSAGTDSVGAKLLFGKKLQEWEHLANLGISREVGENSSDNEAYEVAWKTKYRYSSNFEPGFEYYGDFGDTTTNYDGQSHRIGPTAYGDIGPIGYDAGILVGISDAAPDATLKLNLEYEF